MEFRRASLIENMGIAAVVCWLYISGLTAIIACGEKSITTRANLLRDPIAMKEESQREMKYWKEMHKNGGYLVR